jgi:ribosomal protein S18 acetylase RimI-like enzyme
MVASAQIRPARPEEYPAVGELTVNAYVGDELLSAGAAYVDQLADAAGRAADSELLVAVDEVDTVLGSVTFVQAGSRYCELARPGEAEIRMLVVDAKSRGQGLGEALVRACLERAKASGVNRIRLCTQPNMVRALPIYLRLGFVRTPELDWSPLRDVKLLAYALELQ